jgi:cytochrome oxidase Cu insertion factor (SCO1/SenC/PrrC family)
MVASVSGGQGVKNDMSADSARAPELPPQDPDLMQLSVHSLPSLQGPADDQGLLKKRTRAGRINMLMVLLVCAAPVLLSYYMYYVVRPEGRVNHGDLIDPPVAMPADHALPLSDQQGKPVAVSSLKDQWLLVTVAGGACDKPCEKMLYLQRQVREALGKDKDRVDRVWLIDDGQPMREALAPAMAGALVLSADAVKLSAWLKPQAGRSLHAHWYLVDPRGQWMMRFDANAEPRQMHKDLSRLLRAAGDADEAGRP